MLNQYRVILLTEESDGSFYGHMETVSGKDKGDALTAVLMTYALSGGDLNKVKRTRVTDVAPPNRTLLGLPCIHVS